MISRLDSNTPYFFENNLPYKLHIINKSLLEIKHSKKQCEVEQAPGGARISPAGTII